MVLVVLVGPVVVLCLSTWLATVVLESVLRETAALVAFGAFLLQLAGLGVAWALQPSDPCFGDGPAYGAVAALVLASAALGGVAFGGTLVATRRHPVSACVAFVGFGLTYVSYVMSYWPTGLAC